MEYQYSKKRNGKITSEYTNHFSFDQIGNTSESPDDTPFINGRVPYSKLLKTKHEGYIIVELTERGEMPTLEERKNWWKLLDRLKKHERNRKTFSPMTDYDRFVWWSDN